MLVKSITELIGNTPLLELNGFSKSKGIDAAIVGKLEYFNPAGSVKDRIAREMIDDAELTGKLKPAGTIIEPTSGNTGIGLSYVSAARGYKCIIVMPDTMSMERRLLMRAYGAQLVLTEGAKGMQGAIDKANELMDEIPGSIVIGQFGNPANPAAHFKTTGPEIWNGMDGDIDIFIAGIGTGGTITGAGQYLKSKNPEIKVVAVEPYSSPLLSKGTAGSHKIQGIGANFVPEVLDKSVYDEIIAVKDDEAFSACREIASSEGLLIGISSGAALCAAVQVAKRPENAKKKIVVILPDSGERYLSIPGFI